MLFRIVRPMKRPESANQYFVQRIPKDLQEAVVDLTLRIPLGSGFVEKTVSAKAQDIRFSLRTSDPAEIKLRNAIAAAHLEQVWLRLRAAKGGGSMRLTQAQVIALSGEVYRTFDRAFTDDPGPSEKWDRYGAAVETARGTAGPAEERLGSLADELLASEAFAIDAAAPQGRAQTRALLIEALAAEELIPSDEALERRFGKQADELLASHALIVDEDTRTRLKRAIADAELDVAKKLKRNAEGDYRPDPNAERFPEWRPPVALKEASPPEKSKHGATKLTFDDLLDRWWSEAQLTRSAKKVTEAGYRTAFRHLAKFLKHDDTANVTTEDIIRFKDHRLRSGTSARTVKTSDLVAFGSVFGYAVNNRLLPSNPAKGVTLKVGKKAKVRERGFDDNEVLAILRKAFAHTRGPKEGEQMAWAKRWVPWLCAFTGARVREMIQLRKEDVYKKEGYWVLRITPEAGTVKTNEYREVPIHRQLIAHGFLEWVKARKAGFLFVQEGAEGLIKSVANRLRVAVREVVADPNVQPFHAWRHRLKTIGLEHGLEGRVLDAIQGHAPGTAGEDYGSVTIKAKAAAIEKLPDIPAC